MQRTGVTLGLVAFGLSVSACQWLVEGTTAFADSSPNVEQVEPSVIKGCEYKDINIAPSKDGGYGQAPFKNPRTYDQKTVYWTPN